MKTGDNVYILTSRYGHGYTVSADVIARETKTQLVLASERKFYKSNQSEVGASSHGSWSNRSTLYLRDDPSIQRYVFEENRNNTLYAIENATRALKKNPDSFALVARLAAAIDKYRALLVRETARRTELEENT